MDMLHYSLVSPYRNGGLTKFSMDLMAQQRNEGYNVFLLSPSAINFF